jgi:hypothetical protein
VVSTSTCAINQSSGSFAGVEVAKGAESRASMKAGIGSAKIDEEKRKMKTMRCIFTIYFI